MIKWVVLWRHTSSSQNNLYCLRSRIVKTMSISLAHNNIWVSISDHTMQEEEEGTKNHRKKARTKKKNKSESFRFHILIKWSISYKNPCRTCYMSRHEQNCFFSNWIRWDRVKYFYGTFRLTRSDNERNKTSSVQPSRKRKTRKMTRNVNKHGMWIEWVWFTIK